MPGLKGPRVGLDCVLAYNTTIAASPTIGSFVIVPETMDANLACAHGKIETPSRASKWKSKIPGMSELSMTFSYMWQGDPGDTVLTALRTAFLAKTPWHWAFMDNDLTAPGPAGAQGILFPGLIFDFPIDQPLEGAMKIDIGVELTRHKISGALVDPAWLIVAPTT